MSVSFFPTGNSKRKQLINFYMCIIYQSARSITGVQSKFCCPELLKICQNVKYYYKCNNYTVWPDPSLTFQQGLETIITTPCPTHFNKFQA